MIMRTTQKKMMSKPVISTELGRNVSSSGVCSGQPSVEWHHSADENQVSSTSSSCLSALAGFRLRVWPLPRRVARDVDVALVVVPRRNAMAPPELARNAPVVDVVEPVVVRRGPVLGHEVDRHRRAAGRVRQARVDRLQADVLERLAGEPGVRVGRGLGHRDEPLIGQHRLDDFAAALAARHDHPVRLFAGQQARGFEVGEHELARGVAIEAAILRRRVVVDRRLQREDRDRREAVPLRRRPSR